MLTPISFGTGIFVKSSERTIGFTSSRGDMMKEMLIKFDYMEKDEIKSSVTVYKDKTIECEDFSTVPFETVFGKCPHTIEYLYKFFERRCFAREHSHVGELLHSIGLAQYNPLDIVLISHGRMVGDHNWIKFDSEALSWEDVKQQKYQRFDLEGWRQRVNKKK